MNIIGHEKFESLRVGFTLGLVEYSEPILLVQSNSKKENNRNDFKTRWQK